MSSVHPNAFYFFIALSLIASLCTSAAAQSHLTGTLPDGATYVIDVPAKWNGTLLLYSHGYNAGPSNPAYDVGDGSSGNYLLNAGYALAGSSYSTTGWAVHEAIPDQIATLDAFASLVGTPTQTIAWGHSLGGMITAGLVQEYPGRFQGALPMCGVVGGGVGLWNTVLDAAFTFNTLVAGGSLQVADISDPTDNFNNAEGWLGYAQSTPQGQARIALTAAMADVPGWFDPGAGDPVTNYPAQELNQFYWLAYDDFPFAFYYRAELEGRAGGNISWNTSVNYATQLKKSVDNAEVKALYAAAGLNLNDDLAALASAARISVDPTVEQYLIQNIVYNGQLPFPVLTLHTVGDGLVPVENEAAYLATAKEAGDSSNLREVFVNRAGHCTFTPAETVTALNALTTRIATGKWNISPGNLDTEARGLGPTMNYLYLNNEVVYTAPDFVSYTPAQFLRPFDAFNKQ